MDPAVVTLCVLAVACFLFVTELIPLAVTAMAACTALGILGVLPSKQVYAGLSNSTVVLFGGMFVIGAAMFRTGLAQAIGLGVVKKRVLKKCHSWAQLCSLPSFCLLYLPIRVQ